MLPKKLPISGTSAARLSRLLEPVPLFHLLSTCAPGSATSLRKAARVAGLRPRERVSGPSGGGCPGGPQAAAPCSPY